jgi:hypothetical protein
MLIFQSLDQPFSFHNLRLQANMDVFFAPQPTVINHPQSMYNEVSAGELRTAAVHLSDLLLDVLRESFGLTGAKPGCWNGDCGLKERLHKQIEL